MKNVEKASAGGKFNPSFGLSNTGIAGTGADKEDDDAHSIGTGTVAMPVNTGAVEEEMKDVSKKGDTLALFVIFILVYLISGNKLTFYKFKSNLTISEITFFYFSGFVFTHQCLHHAHPIVLISYVFSVYLQYLA